MVQLPRIAATDGAFALWCHGGDRVVTWGNAEAGGDCSQVQNQLKNLQQVEGKVVAFVALCGDGTVVTWGNFYGDSNDDREWITAPGPLENVQKIYSTGDAFAAHHHDGTVSTWGHNLYGGDSSQVQSQLTDVREIVATGGAFSALRHDGAVVTWGDAELAGDNSNVQHKLKHVEKVYATIEGAFAALLRDRTVVAWGDPDSGDCSNVQGHGNSQHLWSICCLAK